MSGFQGFSRIGGLHMAERTQAPGGFGAMLAQLGNVLTRMVRVATTRRDLAEMDERMLKDLGISRAQAQFEASRAPWELSNTRR